MQPDGPFRMIEMLGSCPIGTVWSAVDPQGLPLTVAVLAGGGDTLWRDAFAATANSLDHAESEPRGRYADFSATDPWVAWPADGGPGAERIFLALGQDYHPAPPHTGAPEPATPANDAAEQDPVEHNPVEHDPVEQNPAEHEPAATGSPWPPPDLPVSGPRITPSPPSVARRWRLSSRRTLTAVLAIAVAVLLIGAAAFAWRWSSADEPVERSPQPTASAVPTPLPTTAPRQPGGEPPRAGGWPTTWPRFAPTDRIRTLSGLDGLGFTVKIPSQWQCVLDGRAPGFARYRCGAGDDQQVGGELIVRDCPEQCPTGRRTAMRQAEEAWGLRWVSAGPLATYAESSSLQIDGARRYGLVVVAFWRSGGDGAVDRQLVFRMTAPVQGAGQLRRVAGYLRDTVIF